MKYPVPMKHTIEIIIGTVTVSTAIAASDDIVPNIALSTFILIEE